MKILASVYKLKGVPGNPDGEPWEEPKTYLGADIVKGMNDAGQEYFLMGSETYIGNSIRSIQTKLENEGLTAMEERGLRLNKTAKGPLPTGYRPELDVSKILGPKDANWYQQLIGILNWIVELGRIDIHNSVARLSAFLAQPREGHLNAALHLFSYLKNDNHQLLPFDPAMPKMDDEFYAETDLGTMEKFKDFYPDACDEIPLDAPEALGGQIRIICFVDADHAGDKLTRRSYTGIIIKLNGAVVFTFSKRQTTVEAATFGSELIASRIAKEKVQALLYKLRMMGVPVISPSIMVVDNESVVKSVSVPESRLKKKHLSICYHSVREAVAGGIIAVKWVKSEDNLADICTKIMSGVTFKRLLGWILIARRLRQVRKD